MITGWAAFENHLLYMNVLPKNHNVLNLIDGVLYFLLVALALEQIVFLVAS
jgi:hypothetical protein